MMGEKLFFISQSNIENITGDIKIIVVFLSGLGENPYSPNDKRFSYLAQKNVLCIRPYLSLWNWMNDETIKMLDEILDNYILKYNLQNVSIVLSGASMGGYGALYYSCFGKHKIASVIVDSPVVDLLYFLHERKDSYMSLYSAFHSIGTDIEQICKNRSILNIFDKLDKSISYHIFTNTNDPEINPKLHSYTLYNNLKERGFNVNLNNINGSNHCGLDEESKHKYIGAILQLITE